MKILVIIPAYNEEQNILNVVKNIQNYKKYKLDYIVINDGSTDKTLDVLVSNHLNFISLANNLGIGAAVQTGYKYAYDHDYDIAIQFDGDGQHDINSIEKLITQIQNGADMVVGSRFIGTESKFKSTKMRQMGIKIISVFIFLFTHKQIKDTTSGYRACNKVITAKFANDYPFDYPEPITNFLLLKENYKVVETGVKMHERKHGKSSIRAFKSILYMLNVIITIFALNFRRDKNAK